MSNLEHNISGLEIYKAVFSPIFHLGILPLPVASGCRFYPSCSEYSEESFNKYNIITAFIKSIYRIIRCNPLSRPGIDLP